MYSIAVVSGDPLTGPPAKIFWPMMRRLAGVSEGDCLITSVLSRSSQDREVSVEEVDEGTDTLMFELGNQLKPGSHILTVGPLATKAMLPHVFDSMPVNNGMTYNTVADDKVVPCWDANTFLSGGESGKDPLAWAGDAMAHFMKHNRYVREIHIPEWEEYSGTQASDASAYDIVGVDTEGTPENPECMTFAYGGHRVYVEDPYDVRNIFEAFRIHNIRLAYHNAPWDWKVIETMGVKDPHLIPFIDTMEKAYIRQTEPQGLKALGKRHYGVDMASWEDVVMPRYTEIVSAVIQGRVEAGTTTTTHSPKTGKEYKKPKVEYTEDAKKLRKLKDPMKMAAAIGFEAPSLKHCPAEEMIEYATLDPFITYKLAGIL